MIEGLTEVEVTTQYFRIDGADQETGEETYLVLQAPTKPLAEKLARQQGLLISSVRVARPDDWGGETEQAAQTPPMEPYEYEYTEHVPPPPPQEQAPASERFREMRSAPEPAAQEYGDPYEEEAAPPPVPSMPSAPGSAAAIVLACAGAALVIGGVLAVALGLWPDNAVRNELQQLDFRMHELSQTVFGGMLILGGLVVFMLAVICYLLPRRR